MRNSINATKKKMSKKAKGLVGALQGTVEPMEHIVDQSTHQFGSLTKYIKANWKTIAPALAALGVSAYFFRNHSKKSLGK